MRIKLAAAPRGWRPPTLRQTFHQFARPAIRIQLRRRTGLAVAMQVTDALTQSRHRDRLDLAEGADRPTPGRPSTRARCSSKASTLRSASAPR